MTANSPPYALQAGSHSAQLFRQALSTLLGSAGGIVDAGDYLVTQNGTPNMSVNVAGGVPGGRIWIPGTTSTGPQGLYYGYNDATVNLAIAASNPSNPRIDRVVAQVQDAAYAGAVNSFSVAAVTGTPAGSPVAPSAPASSLSLATVAVAALATTVVTANITDTRVSARLSTFADASLSTYKSVIRAGGALQASPAATYILGMAGANNGMTAPPMSIAVSSMFYYDPADYAAVSRLTKLRLSQGVITDAVAPGINFVTGMYPVATLGGASGFSPTIASLGTVVSGSTSTVTTPGVSAITRATSGDFTPPASAGWYVIASATNATGAASATVQVLADLQVRQV